MPLLGVVERRADVEARPLRRFRCRAPGRRCSRPAGRETPLPGQRVEGAAQGQRGRGEHHRGRPNSCSRSSPPTDSGATCSVGGLCRSAPNVGEPDHVDARRRVRLLERVSSRSAVSWTSSSAARAALRPAAASGSSSALAADRACAGARASRTATSAPAERLGQGVHAAGRAGRRARGRALARLLQPVGDGPASISLPQRRATRRDHARQLAGGDPGDPVDELVRLVDDHHVVLGQHR